MSAQLPVTVTPEDLDHAMRALAKFHDNPDLSGWHRCGDCLIAQALHRTTGDVATVGIHRAAVGRVRLNLPVEAKELIILFDNEAYDVLRSRLPQTVIFEVRE